MMAYTVTFDVNAEMEDYVYVNCDVTSGRNRLGTLDVFVGSNTVSTTGTITLSLKYTSSDVEENWQFVNWTDDLGNVVGSNKSLSNYNVTRDVTLTANYIVKVQTYTITILTNDNSMGTITGEGLVYDEGQYQGTYVAGTPVTFTAVPSDASRYLFQKWNDSSTNPSKSFTVSKDLTIYANFAEIAKFNIEVNSNNPTAGTVTGTGVYLSGADVPLTATPNTGYYFAYWSDGLYPADRTVQATSNKTYTATFLKLLKLEVVPDADEAGSTTGDATGLKPGDKVTIEAHPNTGYVFVEWDDHETTNPRVVEMGDENVKLMAKFREVRYTLTLGVNDGAMGSVIGTAGDYKAGMAVNISAAANAGYEFVGWSDGETAATRTVTMDANKNLTANFEPIVKAVRNVSNGRLGSICLPRAVAAGDFEGAKFYKIAYKVVDAKGDPADIFFDEVTELEAGMPYIFKPEAGAENITVKYTGAAEAAKHENGLYGTYEAIDVRVGCYVVSSNKLVKCAAGSQMNGNRAYIKMNEVCTEADYTAPAEAPARISFSLNEGNVATDLETLLSEKVQKVMIDGQIYIQREGQLYNVNGQLVK